MSKDSSVYCYKKYKQRLQKKKKKLMKGTKIFLKKEKKETKLS